MRALCMLAVGLAAACGGGGGTSDAGDEAGSSPDGCACFDAPAPDAATPRTITVLNANGTALTSFHASDTGNVAPFASLGGNQTNLSGAIALGADAQGSVYVVTQLAILVFPPGATGNVAPARTIAGSNVLASTDIFAGIAIANDGTIYAASELASGTMRNPKINVFPPGSNGNVAPSRTATGSSTTMTTVLSMAVSGNQTVIADASQNILFFDTQATGNAAPLRTLKSTAGLAVGVTLDLVGDVFVADWNFSTSSVVRWASGAQGTTAPSATLTGAATKITAIGGVAVDLDDTIFVANADPGGAAILVFPPGANGNIAPLREISGASTTLSGDASQGPMPLVVY
jgi:hypothetical protein